MYPKGKKWSPEQRRSFFATRIESRKKKGLPIPPRWFEEIKSVALTTETADTLRGKLNELRRALDSFEKMFG